MQGAGNRWFHSLRNKCLPPLASKAVEFRSARNVHPVPTRTTSNWPVGEPVEPQDGSCSRASHH